jgi:hypothetical protein
VECVGHVMDWKCAVMDGIVELGPCETFVGLELGACCIG